MEFCSGYHVLGRRCGCGYLAVPVRFYWYKMEGGRVVGEMLKGKLSQGEAEAAYLGWLKKEGGFRSFDAR